MQSGACITLSGARREFRIYATMLPTRPDDTSAQRECLCHSLFLCLRHCLCVCVPWCVCVWDKLFKQQLRFLKSTLLCGGAGDSICGKQTSTKLLQPQPTCTDVHRHACSHIRECISICSGTFCSSMCVRVSVLVCVWHTFQTHKNIAAHFSTLFTPTIVWEGTELAKGGGCGWGKVEWEGARAS